MSCGCVEITFIRYYKKLTSQESVGIVRFAQVTLARYHHTGAARNRSEFNFGAKWLGMPGWPGGVRVSREEAEISANRPSSAHVFSILLIPKSRKY